MSARSAALRRTTYWYASRGRRIPRKIAWKVLGFGSPKAYRAWRDVVIRHDRANRREGVWRESPTCDRWAACAAMGAGLLAA